MNDGTKETTTVGEVLRASIVAVNYAWELQPLPPTFHPSRGYPEGRKRKDAAFKNRRKGR